MNVEERPPELDIDSTSPSAITSKRTALSGENHLAFERSSADRSALSLLELENLNLRRLIVELLEKNQRLREQLQAASTRDARIVADVTPPPRVDPQAA
jgi:hypothetical protein